MTYLVHDFSAETAATPPAWQLDRFAKSASTADVGIIGRAANDETVTRTVDVPADDLSARLSQATAQAKLWTSQVSMRLAPEDRLRFFRQLDRLHEEDEWLEGSKPLDLDSYKSFIRAYVSRSVAGKPALSLTPDGCVAAIWEANGSKLVIEFLPQDRARYLVSQVLNSESERAAGEASIARLPALLSPFSASAWFGAR
jgi:hypothetical protein